MKYVTFGVRDLQANLGKALRALQRGERVMVTSRGKLVAVMAPMDAELPRESALDRKLRRLAAEGRIRLGEGKLIKDYDAPPVSGLSDQALADRR